MLFLCKVGDAIRLLRRLGTTDNAVHLRQRGLFRDKYKGWLDACINLIVSDPDKPMSHEEGYLHMLETIQRHIQAN